MKAHIGEIFGRLIVLAEGVPIIRSNGYTRRLMWCKCICGGGKFIRLESLTSGQTTSCGCLHKERTREARKRAGRVISNGDVFGLLTVTSEAPPRVQKSGLRKGRENRAFRCTCRCGNQTTAYGSQLLSGQTKTCGCSAPLRSPELKLGAVYGEWVVIRSDNCIKEGTEKLRRVRCRCSCGVESNVRRKNLVKLSNASHSCGHSYNKSVGEQAIAAFISSLEPSFELELNSRTRLKPSRRELDIYLHREALGVEFNGNYWHCTKVNGNTHSHFEKRVMAEEAGIRLIQIRSDEWAFKPQIVKSIIRSVLGKNENRHFARKLQIKEVPGPQAKDFLNENHLMGDFRASRSVGLFTKENELVQIFAFRLHKNKTELDCTRICSLRNTTVVGGVSRLLKHVIRQHDTLERVVSFVDLRYGTGDSLLKMGFELKSTTLGWGWTNGRKWLPKLGVRERVVKVKWFKLYDAGQAKFVMEL